MIPINDKYFKYPTSPPPNNLMHKKYLYAALLAGESHNGENCRNSISILTICYLIVTIVHWPRQDIIGDFDRGALTEEIAQLVKCLVVLSDVKQLSW